MSEQQIILIGLVATALTWLLKVAVSYANYKPSRVVINVVLYAISALLAVGWSGAQIPGFPSFDANIGAYVGLLWQYLNDWIALAAPVLGSATLIYNLLYEKVVVPAFAKVSKK